MLCQRAELGTRDQDYHMSSEAIASHPQVDPSRQRLPLCVILDLCAQIVAEGAKIEEQSLERDKVARCYGGSSRCWATDRAAFGVRLRKLREFCERFKIVDRSKDIFEPRLSRLIA